MLKRTYDQLTSIRLTRELTIERFFADRLNEATFPAITVGAKMKWLASSGYYSGYMIFNSAGKAVSGFISDSCINRSVTDLKPEELTASKEAIILDYPHNHHHCNYLLTVSPMGSPGRDQEFLVMVIKPDCIDRLMLEVSPDHGLGYSGETYMVGSDYLMRSNSRFIAHSIMNTKVNTESVQQALKGRHGPVLTNDYRGVEVLSSYGRIKVKGLDWVMLAELDYKEVMTPVYALRNNIILLSLITAMAFFILTYTISTRITRQLKRLKNAAVEVGDGRLQPPVPVLSQDETGELTEAFNRMTIRLYEKDEALKAERLNSVKSAIDGQDTERQRLSRELHDGIGQGVIGIRLRLAALENELPEKIKNNFRSIIQITDNLVEEVRTTSNALMPPALAEFGLMPAIRSTCDMMSETYHTRVVLKGEIPAGLLGRTPILYVFRIIQESLNNAARHSGAACIVLNIRLANDSLFIEITDDGKGFDASAVQAGQHGLNNIRERVNLLKGKVAISSSVGSGTHILIEIPANLNTL